MFGIAPTWDVVATVRDRPEVLQAFVHHHLGAGCRRVHLYFDDPADPLLGLWQGRPGVSAQIGRQPRGREAAGDLPWHARQSANASHALANSIADWIAHLEADEWLYAADRVSTVLDALPADTVQVRALTHEAVFESWAAAQLPFNCRHFRRGAEGEDGRKQALAVYGEAVHPLLSRGMAGHAVGRCLVRCTGVAAVGGVHFWRDKHSGEWLPATVLDDRSLVLLHFDAVSYPAWKEKLMQAAWAPAAANQERQAERFAKARGQESELQRLFRGMYVLDERQRTLMEEEGALYSLDKPLALPRTLL